MSTQRTWTEAEQQVMAREAANRRTAICPIDGAEVETTVDTTPAGKIVSLLCRTCGNDAAVAVEG